MDSCVVCLEVNVDASCRIFTTLKEWHGMQQVIKKHLSWWCLRDTSNHNSAQWICRNCWQEISSFHYFYVRVENAQQFPMFSVCENVLKSPNTDLKVNVLKNADEVVKRRRESTEKLMENMRLTVVNIENKVSVHEIKALEQDNTIKQLKGNKHSIVNDDCDVLDSKIVDSIEQNTAIDDDLKEFLMESKQKEHVFKDVNIRTDSFNQLNAIKLEELTIVDIKHETASESTNEINFNYELEPMDQQDEKECKLEFSPTNNSECNYGKQFHNSIKNYLDYQERREGIKNLNRINDEFIAANFKLFCDICNEDFSNYKILKIHYQAKHNIPGYATCCGKKLYKQPLVVDHIHYHKNADYFKCPDCGKTYSSRYYFLYHIGEHKKRLSRTIECHICGIKLATKAKLKNHINRMHVEENLKEHICPICSRVSASFGIHKDHIKFAHATERKHKCHLCTKAFKYPKLLREHISTHTRIALYSCPYCSKTFIRSGDMYNHRKSVHFKEWEEEQLKRPLYRQKERGKRKKLALDLSDS